MAKLTATTRNAIKSKYPQIGQTKKLADSSRQAMMMNQEAVRRMSKK